ncbi:MAG: prenyltransferase/squalene oxidase repeat-containing protein, partial [Planctomycetota bacterium]
MIRKRILCGLLASLLPALLVPPTARGGEKEEKKERKKTLLEKRIDRAVKSAVEWFRENQNPRGKGKEGAWSFREPYWESGVTSLALFTMLRAGIDRDDPMIQAGFRYLTTNISPGKRISEMYTYNISTQMLAIAEGYGEMLKSRKPKNQKEAALKAIFEANFDYCKKALKKGEAGYTIGQEGIDLSNTQFLVMALETAHRVGYTIPASTWMEIFIKGMELQAPDGPPVHRVNILSRKADEVDKHGYVIKQRYGWIPGKPAKARGWSYGEFFKKDEIYGSMTCAGIANLLSCFFVLEKDKAFKAREKAFQNAVRDGFAWLQTYFAVNENPAEPGFWSMGRRYEGDTFWTYYYLFTLARITTATNIRFIGNRNWYLEGADFLLKAQNPKGYWDQVAHETHNFKSDCIPFVNTAFALWFFSSLDQPKKADPFDVAKAAREKGEAPDPKGNFLKNLLQLLEDVYTEKERWDVDRPFEGTADVLIGLAPHPAYKEWKGKKPVKESLKYLRNAIIPNRGAMESLAKKVRAPDPMTERYAMQML